MDNTFNQAFKPITNTKSIKDYESEIDTLNSEVFELKSRLTQLSQNIQHSAPPYEINRILIDSQASIDILENENKRLKSELAVAQASNRNDGLKNDNIRLKESIDDIRKEWEMKCNKLIKEKELVNAELWRVREKQNMNNFPEKIQQLEEEKNNIIEEMQRRENTYKDHLYQLEQEFNNQKKQGFNDYEMKLKAVSSENSAYNKNIVGLNNQLLHIKGLYNGVLKENDTLKHDINSKEKSIKEMREMCTDIEKDKILIEKELEAIRKGELSFKEDIHERLEEKERIIGELGNKITAMEREMSKTSEMVQKAHRTEIEHLNNGIKRLLDEKNELQKTKDRYLRQRNEYIDKFNKQTDKENNNNNEKWGQHKISQLDSEINLLRQNEKSNLLQIEYYKGMILKVGKYLKSYEAMIKTIHNNIGNMYIKIRSLKNKNMNKNNNIMKNANLKDINLILNKTNLNFIRSNFPFESDIDEVIVKISRIFNKMTERINVLENDTKQLEIFAGNSAKQDKNEMNKFIDNFVVEFKNARGELEFCKNYLKEKSKALKELKNERKSHQQKIKELESKVDAFSNKDEKKKSFFSRLY